MRRLFLILITLCVSSGFIQAQDANLDYTRWYLPEGAIARLGKGGIIGKIAFSPDSRMIAIPSMIGIWLYEAQTYKELALLTGDTSGNDKLEFSPDGTILVKVDGWGGETIQLWDMSNRAELGKQKVSLIEHRRDVSSITFSPDGKTLACICDDRTIVLWNPHTGEHKITLKGHTNRITAIAFTPDSHKLASASYNGKVRLWDVKTGKQVRILKEDKQVVYAMAFSSDSRTLANLIFDRQKGVVTEIRLLDTSTGKQIRTFYADENAFSRVMDPVDCSVMFSPDALTIVGMGEHWSMRGEHWTILWDVKSGKQILASKSGLVISPDWHLKTSVEQDEIVLSEMKTGNRVKTLTGYKKGYTPLIFSPDGKILANDLGIWDIKTGKHTEINEKHVSIGLSTMFLENGDILANWWSDQPIRFWNTKTLKHSEPFTGDIFAVSSDGKTVAGGFRNWLKPSTIHLWNAKTHALKLTIDTNNEQGRQQLAFSPDGNTLVSSGQKTLDLYDANTGEHKLTLNDKPNNNRPVVFYPDNQILIRLAADDIQLWNVKTGAHIATLTGHTSHVETIIFSPDGNMFASESWDETIRLWDAKTYENIATLIGHTDQLTSIAFSPDGETLATASIDTTVRLWDTKTGKHKKVLLGHKEWVTCVAFYPDGETLVSAGGKTIRFWNTETWEHKLTLRTHIDDVSSIVFSPDGKTMVSVGRTILLWKLDNSITLK